MPTFWIMAAVILVSLTATTLGMMRTSTTFDEITVIAAGARGWETGDFAMMPNYPPVTQYLYGLPVYLSKPVYPVELRRDTVPHRYAYAQQFLFRSGNDPERLAFIARVMGVLCAGLLVLLTYLFGAWCIGTGAGLLAASLVAFLPDVLAHGGIAYNDIPLAAAYLAAVWALDAVVRRPSLARAVAAGATTSIAVGIKYTALVLGPIAIALLMAELIVSRHRSDFTRWGKSVLGSVFVALLVGYALQVVFYEGDFSLRFLREGAIGAKTHVLQGHGVATYLLGQMHAEAPWYSYLVQFLFKTSIAVHLLILLAIAGAVLVAKAGPWRAILSMRLRAPMIAFSVFAVFLTRSNLTIGFRYLLPLLPLICLLTAAGLMALWPHVSPVIRTAIVALVMWSAVSSLAYYPHFLAYTSEYQGDPDLAVSTFVDSNLDWGQGLLALRDFMKEEEIPTIYLSYFGSALPEAYGIKYIPLPSFFPLPMQAAPIKAPRFAAVSATNLVGLYLPGDPFAKLRQATPYRVLAHTIFVYRLQQ